MTFDEWAGDYAEPLRSVDLDAEQRTLGRILAGSMRWFLNMSRERPHSHVATLVDGTTDDEGATLRDDLEWLWERRDRIVMAGAASPHDPGLADEIERLGKHWLALGVFRSYDNTIRSRCGEELLALLRRSTETKP